MSDEAGSEMPFEAGVDELPTDGNESGKSHHLQILNYITLIIFTFGCIGNILIIFYFTKIDRKKKKSMTAYHFLITVLAILDWNVCAMKIVKTALMVIYHNERMKINLMMEKVLHLLSTYFYRCLTATSIYILVIISFLRYQRITNPFRPAWNKSIYFMLCFLSWCLCTGIWLFVFFVKFAKSWLLDPIVIGVFPLIMLCFFYYKMFKSLKTNHNNNRNSRKSKESISRSSSTIIANDQTKERNMVALRTVKYLIVVYFVTVVLVKIVLYSFVVPPEMEMENFLLYESYVDFFYMINNMANVLVYAKLICGFRCFLKKFFTCGRMVKSNSASSI